MTTTALDPFVAETAAVAPRAGRSIRRSGARRRPIEKGRILVVACVGAAVIGGFAGAMTLLSGLAGPRPRPVMAMNTRAAEWPDLRDGVPVLARPAEAQPRDALPSAGAPVALRAAIDPVATTPPVVAVTPSPQASAVGAKAAAKLPQIENAALVTTMREAALVTASRGAALVRPLASETVKARTAAASTFTALAPEETTASVAEPARESVTPREAVKPRATRATAVKPARAPAAEAHAATASTVTEPEADETEVLGMKIPSLAATGRKLREALGGGESASAASE